MLERKGKGGWVDECLCGWGKTIWDDVFEELSKQF